MRITPGLLLEKAEEVQDFATKEFATIKVMHDIIMKAQQRVRNLSEAETQLVMKSVFRQNKRLLRKLAREERALNVKTMDFLDALKEFAKLLEHSTYYSAFLEFIEELSIIDSYAVQYCARKGKIYQEFNKGYENANKVIREAYQIIFEPLAGYLHNLHDYLTANQMGITRYILKTIYLNIDISTFLARLQPLDETIVILDASFVREAFDAMVAEGKKELQLDIKAHRLVIPKTVLQELAHRRRLIGNPLVPQPIVDYLLHDLGAVIEKIDPKPAEISQIKSFWRSTVKGKEDSFRKFRISGDMDILVYILRNSKLSIAVMSNDQDLSNTVINMRSKGACANNVRVYKFNYRGTMQLAA